MTSQDLCSPSFVLLSLCLACAPGDAGPQDVGSDETGGTASSTDTPDDTTTGHTGNVSAGSGSDSDGGTASASSGEGGSTGDGGGDTPGFGEYELARGDATITPQGCAMDQGRDAAWSITLDAPTDGVAAFVLHESYGPYAGVFDCTRAGESEFTCTRSFVVDYAAMGGPDARVQLDSTYLGAWTSATTIAGSYDATFTCSGTACDDATDDWNITAFPCDIAVAFTGTATGSGGA